jgi:hypothetical protein
VPNVSPVKIVLAIKNLHPHSDAHQTSHLPGSSHFFCSHSFCFGFIYQYLLIPCPACFRYLSTRFLPLFLFPLCSFRFGFAYQYLLITCPACFPSRSFSFDSICQYPLVASRMFPLFSGYSRSPFLDSVSGNSRSLRFLASTVHRSGSPNCSRILFLSSAKPPASNYGRQYLLSFSLRSSSFTYYLFYYYQYFTCGASTYLIIFPLYLLFMDSRSKPTDLRSSHVSPHGNELKPRIRSNRRQSRLSNNLN